MANSRNILLAVTFALGLFACADATEEGPPLVMEVRALGSGECGPAAGSTVNPFSDMKSAQVIERGIDPVDGAYKVLVNETKSLSGK